MNNLWTSLPRPILALAPMEGVTDFAFRAICKDWGADVVYTEFVSADAIAHGAKKVLDKLKYDEAQRPVVAQIFGHDSEAFAYAAKLIAKLGFDGLDINLGCPARKVINHGSGGALLRDPKFARQLILKAVESCDLPVSLKMRTSVRKEAKSTERVTALDFLAAINDLPIAAIMVHGRALEQGHSGEVDLAMIAEVKKRFSGVVLANGGVFSPEIAKQTLEATGADGLGLARGTWGQPWLFKQVKGYLATGQYHNIPTADRLASIIKQAELADQDKGRRGLLEFRKHLAKYIRDFPGAADLRHQAVQIETVADVRKIINQVPKV
jgi:tRNA-dihydrouridine synthase B